jgi:hypothetical protein
MLREFDLYARQKRRRAMKGMVTGLLALAVLAALAILFGTSKHAVLPVYAQNGCSLATLTGNYAFSQSGFEPKGAQGNPLPFANVGVSTFDGGGNVSVTYTDVSPGKPVGYRVPLLGSGSGTYTVNSDCTGSASFISGNAAGITINFVIIGGGTEAFAINTTPFIIATSDFKKQ